MTQQSKYLIWQKNKAPSIMMMMMMLLFGLNWEENGLNPNEDYCPPTNQGTGDSAEEDVDTMCKHAKGPKNFHQCFTRSDVCVCLVHTT